MGEVTDDKSLPKARRMELQVEHAVHISPQAKLVKLADKIANVWDVGGQPPSDWSIERRHEYAQWAKRVFDGLRGVHPILEVQFDQAHAAVLAEQHHRGHFYAPAMTGTQSGKPCQIPSI